MNTFPSSNYVIFAAGIGSRMNVDSPKFLFEIDQRSVFQYQLAELAKFPGCLYIVCGYRADAVCERVCEFVDRLDEFVPQVCFVYNPDYAMSQVTSIHRALRTVPLDRPTFLIDGDMLFHRDTIAALHAAERTTVVVRSDVSRDAVIANVDDRRLISFCRTDSAVIDSAAQEWANIAKYVPADLPGLLQLSGDADIPHHFELINQLIVSGATTHIHNDAVAEIDQPDDVAKAVVFARRLK